MSTDPEKSDPDQPKIIIDEDWKTRVQAEKEAAQKKKEGEEQGGSGEEKGESESDPAAADAEIPPASFLVLATTLATQAMMAMGLFPAGEGEQPMVRLDIAKHHIDMLGVLEEKTKGNLTPEEEAMLGDTLHQLRMAYLQVSNAPQGPQS